MAFPSSRLTWALHLDLCFTNPQSLSPARAPTLVIVPYCIPFYTRRETSSVTASI